jgi:hypothetical protein
VATDGKSTVVFTEDGTPALHDLPSGAVEPLPARLPDDDARVLDQYHQGAERIYDDKFTLWVRPMEHRSGLFPVQWTDVFLREGETEKNVSDCDGAPCGQPALSFDRNRIAYVKGRIVR